MSPMIRFDDDGILAVTVNDTMASITRNNWKKAGFDRIIVDDFLLEMCKDTDVCVLLTKKMCKIVG